MFGVGGNIVKAEKEPAGLLAPVIDSVVNGSIVNSLPFAGAGFKDLLTLSGGAVDPSLTEYLYTDFDGGTGSSPYPYPGGDWTTYTGAGGDDQMDWDDGLGNVVDQPPALGPVIDINEIFWNDFGDSFINAGGGGRWKRLQITVKNAAGSDSAFIFWQGDAF